MELIQISRSVNQHATLTAETSLRGVLLLGIRSDSDLFTFGFAWCPWKSKQSIASGASILKYFKESAASVGLDKNIKYHYKVRQMQWDTGSATWTFHIHIKDGTDASTALKSRFVFLGTGYYDFDEPLKALIPGLDNFQGRTIHPQFWPSDIRYKNKEVVIIGSGATAVTLLPSIAKEASRVTMLQRSPSYILSIPEQGGFEKVTMACCPSSMAYKLIRLKWMLFSFLMVRFCRYFPAVSKKAILYATKRELPPGTALHPDFVPSYNPWDQRMCFCPDGDFYQALRDGNATVMTGVIASSTTDSITLDSGQTLHPDIIVTATGLKLRAAGGIEILVDGAPFDLGAQFSWKNAMLEDLPNAALAWGYVDASWTLGAEATSRLACRLLRRMADGGYTKVVPRRTDEERQTMAEVPMMNLKSTYVVKGNSAMPKCGDRGPWMPRSYYVKDLARAKWGDIEAGLCWS